MIDELAYKGRHITTLAEGWEQERATVRSLRAEVNMREKELMDIKEERDRLLTRLARYRAGRA